MASIAENKRQWNGYDWSKAGHEWSGPWGTAAHQWANTWLSRIAGFLPSKTILEIAPGFGRWSRYLIPECEHYYGVDLADTAVDACRRTFSRYSHAIFIVTDGRSLPGVPDASIDFAFSADSLVHADKEALIGYLDELRRVLRPGGTAFLHHSNLGAFVADVRNDYWRDLTVSAELIRDNCALIGLSCQTQELINWAQPELNDCFSLITNSRQQQDTKIIMNSNFGDEMNRSRHFSEVYGSAASLANAQP